MNPLAQLPLEKARSVRVILTDIDDTITSEGMLTASAYAALENLQCAGFLVIPVTGRPAGWSITSPACGRSMPSSEKTAPFISATTVSGKRCISISGRNLRN